MVLALMTLLWGWLVRWAAREGSPAALLNARGDETGASRDSTPNHTTPHVSGAEPPRPASYRLKTKATRAQRTEEMDKT